MIPVSYPKSRPPVAEMVAMKLVSASPLSRRETSRDCVIGSSSVREQGHSGGVSLTLQHLTEHRKSEYFHISMILMLFLA